MQNRICKGQTNHVLLLLIVSGVLLSIRAQFGYFFNDEPFIVTLAQRLSHGADLIVDEWNTTQNFGVLLLPLYQLYVAIVGRTEGILLVFRMIYCFMWASTCSAVYYVIRQRYPGALIVFLYLIFFSPLEQMTLSYTSVSLSCVLLIAGLFCYHFTVSPLSLFIFTSLYTILSVIAVISLPYLAVIYALNAILIVVVHLIKKNNTTSFLLHANLISCALAVAAAIFYLYLFVLSKHDLADILQSLGYILSSDYGASSSFIQIVTMFFLTCMRSCPGYLFMIGLSILLQYTSSIKHHPGRKYVLFFINCLAYWMEFLTLIMRTKNQADFYFNAQMLPIVFLGILAFFMLNNRKEYLPLFLSFVVYGALFSLAFYFASDTGLAAISMGLSVCGVASIIFIAALGKECKQFYLHNSSTMSNSGGEPCKHRHLQGKIMAAVFVLVFFSQISAEALMKCERQYWDSSLQNMTATISNGAGRGIRTTSHYEKTYAELSNGLNVLLKNVNKQNIQDIRFLSMISCPVLYLDADLPIGCFSTWTFMDDDILLNKLNQYYSVNPSNKPNVIFYENDDTRIQELALDYSDYQSFTYEKYSILIIQDLVKM